MTSSLCQQQSLSEPSPVVAFIICRQTFGTGILFYSQQKIFNDRPYMEKHSLMVECNAGRCSDLKYKCSSSIENIVYFASYHKQI